MLKEGKSRQETHLLLVLTKQTRQAATLNLCLKIAALCELTRFKVETVHFSQETQASCRTFEKQVGRFSDMADLICSMTDDEEGQQMVRLSFQQLDDLKTKLENAIEVSGT